MHSHAIMLETYFFIKYRDMILISTSNLGKIRCVVLLYTRPMYTHMYPRWARICTSGPSLQLVYTHVAGMPQKEESSHSIMVYTIQYHNIIVYAFILIIMRKYLNTYEYTRCMRSP